MARRSIKALQNQIDTSSKKNSGGGTDGYHYPHWNLPEDGSTRIRLLEDPDQENDFVVYAEYKEHKLKIGKDYVRVPCVTNLGATHKCPICEISQKFYKTDEDKGKYYYRDMFAIVRGLVVEDGLVYEEGAETSLGKARLFKFSWQLKNKLNSEIGRLTEEDRFWELDEGFDFTIVKNMVAGSGDKKYGKYDLDTGFERRSTSIPEEWREGIPEDTLTSTFPEIPTYDEAAGILQRHLRAEMGEDGEGGEDGDDSDNSEDHDSLVAKLNRQKESRSSGADSAPAKPAEKAASNEGTSGIADIMGEEAAEDEDDDDDILANLMRNDNS